MDMTQFLARIDRERLQADTEALASIAPRIGGTPGEAEARAWVAGKFREAGLSRVRQQPIYYPQWTGRNAVLLLDGSELNALALHGSASTPPEGLTAPLLDLGPGQPDDYDRLPVAALRGKIHLAVTGAIFRRRTVLRAERTGAAGAVLINPQSTEIEAGTAQIFGKMPIFAVGSRTGRALKCAAAAGAEVTLRVQAKYRLAKSANVFGELPGVSRDYIVLAAHYDAWHSGAADNAAGLAVLLELARLWHGRRFKYTLQFVSFAAEEEGLMGSIFHVLTRLPLVKLRCQGVISPDIAGPRTEALYVSGAPRKTRLAAMERLRATGYAGAEIRENIFGAYGDYWPYSLLGIPGLMLSKMPYPDYHTPGDTPDKLDYEDLAYMAAMVGVLIDDSAMWTDPDPGC